MHSKRSKHYRDVLLAMRRRITGEVEHILEAIQEETNPAGNNSNVPVHLGDLATNSLDADVRVLETEQNMLGEIEAALLRLDQGTYGDCLSCGTPISEERLDNLPHAPLCIQCATTQAQSKNVPR